MSKKEVIKDVIKQLSENGYKAISPKMLPHKLKGNYKGCWECHIQPDLILIWEQEERITGNSTNCSGKSF